MPATTNIRRIGVLTGGGDCPGLNAVIRAVVKTAILQHGIEVAGIEDGFQGLIEDRVRPLSSTDVSGILVRGGTVLATHHAAVPVTITALQGSGTVVAGAERLAALPRP